MSEMYGKIDMHMNEKYGKGDIDMKKDYKKGDMNEEQERRVTWGQYNKRDMDISDRYDKCPYLHDMMHWGHQQVSQL